MHNLSGLPITEFNNNLFATGAGFIATVRAGLRFARTWACATIRTRWLRTSTGINAAVSTQFLANYFGWFE
jgi:hypothetical protein